MPPGRRKPESSLSALAELQSAPTRPVYFLQGKDVFLRDEYLRAIRRKAFGDASDDFNRDRLDWEETDAPAVITIARTLPFTAERRLIEVLNFAKPNERDEALLLSYLDEPSASTILVLCVESADMRTTFFQRLAKASAVCRVDTPKGGELTKWLRGRAAGLGFELRPEAADQLVEMVNPSMARLSAELEKLASYVMPAASAGAEEVREVVGHSKEELLYRLGDSISQGALGETLALLRRMMETEPPVVFIGLLRNLIRRWTISKALMRSGGGARGISETLGVPLFVAQRLEGQAGRLRSAYLRELYGKLLQVDRRLKRTGDMRIARQTLELFLVDMRLSRSGRREIA